MPKETNRGIELTGKAVKFNNYVLRNEDGTLNQVQVEKFLSEFSREIKGSSELTLNVVSEKEFQTLTDKYQKLEPFAVIDPSNNKFNANSLKQAIQTDPSGFKSFIENERNWVNKQIPGLLTRNELVDTNGKLNVSLTKTFFQDHQVEITNILSQNSDLFKKVTGIELKEARLNPNEIFGYYKKKYETEFKNFVFTEQKYITEMLGVKDIELLREQYNRLEVLDRVIFDKEELQAGCRIPNQEVVVGSIGIAHPILGLTAGQKELLKIKGVDESRVQKLATLGISSTTDLLLKARTPDQRLDLAKKLYMLEKKFTLPLKTDEKVKLLPSTVTKYYNSITYWVKQVDLWRISTMDPDSADFMVKIGIRFVEDMKKVDPDKAYPIMEALARTQTDYKFITRARLEELIANAKKTGKRFPLIEDKFEQLIAKPFAKLEKNLIKDLSITSKKRDELLHVISEAKKIDLSSLLFIYTLEIDEPAPTYLFVTDTSAETATAELNVNNAEIIAKGLGFLRDVDQEMPLPRRVVGYVYSMNSYTDTGAEDGNNNTKGFSAAHVELDGIVDPTNDEADAPKPQGETDQNGRFAITLPSGYNLKDVITFTISRGEGNKKGSKNFIVTASEFLGGVDSQKIDNFTKLNKLYEYRYQINFKTDSEIDIFTKNYNEKTASAADKTKYEYCIKYQELKKDFTDIDPNDLYILIEDMLNDTGWETELGKDPEHPLFLIDEATFINNSEKENKLLPSVKFIENNGKSLYLPTDTAPSEVYNYSMIQRLVEPAIAPIPEEGTSTKPRISLNKAIDITNFKDSLQNDPNKIPHMSSLGIGYALNMHQAWVPDGFALGTLLYSTILAPGEEQRLVMREQKQSYEIIDQQEGIDSASENYQSGQTQKTTEAYNQAIAQMSDGGSEFEYEASSKSNSCGGGFFGLFGGSTGKSNSSGSGSTSSYQNNSFNEATNAARNFQNAIKAASEKISQASRLLIKTASSDESDSVSTKIIANHNHSHAMTVQYWEVMRRYKLETCIENVDLILFVPMQMISFLNGQAYQLTEKLDVSTFKDRYELLSKHYDALRRALPYKYRSGLDLAKQYYAYQDFNIDDKSGSTTTIEISFEARTLSFDKIRAVLVLKNGSKVYQNVNIECNTIREDIETASDLRQEIKDIRESGTLKKCTCTFTCTADSISDVAYIKLIHDCSDFEYTLYKNKEHINTAFGESLFGYLNLFEAWTHPHILWRKSYLSNNGLTKLLIENLEVSFNNDVKANNEKNSCTERLQSNDLTYSTVVYMEAEKPFLSVKQQQKIENTMHHIASHTMRYSQAVWNAMSADERALMLEKFTIDMNFKDIEENEDTSYDDIPLLNCIDVRKMLGFYGNCMLFPFTYPEKLAKRLGKTAFELQDALYRYHSNHFRVPTTVISLPTEGMVGEAVLGETNVSEKIDLTRFWNWQDSPIDKMEITSDYLSKTDYLKDKNTSSITPLNIQSATAPTSLDAPDLLKELREKDRPNFGNLTGLDQLKEVLNRGTESAENALSKGMDLTKDALKTSVEGGKALCDSIMGFINGSSKTSMQEDLLKKLIPETKGADGKVSYDTSKVTPDLINAIFGNNTTAAAKSNGEKKETDGKKETNGEKK